jgi:predicted RNase H-like nuclease
MTLVAGVDGCKAGWFVVIANANTGEITDFQRVNKLADLFQYSYKLSIIAVDVPIGLLSDAKSGGRNCDILARGLLGHPRSSSVFSPPVRGALNHPENYSDANYANRKSSKEEIGISKQCFGIFPKIIEANTLINPELQNVIKEVHPEVCFWKMGGEVSSFYSKRVIKGREERLNLLSSVGFSCVSDVFGKYPRSEVQLNDIIDAAAACWTAIRILKGEAIRLPATPDRDTSGLFMENWV